jgi:hypothetical protein
VKLYTELVDAYALLTPREDYEEESAFYQRVLRSALGDGPLELLEVGAGAGHTVSWFEGFALTLTDLSPQMLALAAANVPSARCVVGDMRELRLGRRFDAVFAHDALCHLTTRADLLATARTIAAHLRPGGAALLVPDYVTETFEPSTEHGGGDADGQGVRYLAWCWQREGQDEGYVTDYVVMHRTGDGEPRVGVDRHEEGLFPRETWIAVLAEAGLRAEPVDTEGIGNVAFIARPR